MKHNDQKGFAFIAVFVVVLLLAVGITGWFVLQGRDDREPEPFVSDQWLEYKSADNYISFKYPSNWKVMIADGSKGTNLDSIDSATYTYIVQEPETSAFMDVAVIEKPFSEVIAWQEGLFAKPDFYKNAEIGSPSTKMTEFQFQSHPAVRFETGGVTAFPPDDLPDDVKDNNPKKPVFNTIIYINGGKRVYAIRYGGHTFFDNTSPYNAIYKSLSLLD